MNINILGLEGVVPLEALIYSVLGLEEALGTENILWVCGASNK